MQQALKQTVKIQAGGIVHVQSPELIPGSTAEVIVIPEAGLAQLVSLVRYIGAAQGCYSTPAEADAFLRRERDAWEE
ncbi:MAG: hypothetical protein OEV77_10740 [Nitrospira sp.]|nr:hypothetical protein [Nitrospira sp.]